jgi:hypothetical protein
VSTTTTTYSPRVTPAYLVIPDTGLVVEVNIYVTGVSELRITAHLSVYPTLVIEDALISSYLDHVVKTSHPEPKR